MLLAIEQDRPYEIEFKMPRPDGLSQWCSLLVRGDRSPGGAVEAIGVLSDITRLKAQQSELESARTRSRADVQPVGGGRRLHARRAHSARERGAAAAGRPRRASLGGLSLDALFPDRRRNARRWRQRPRRRCASMAAGAASVQLRRSDGSLLWVQISKRLVARRRSVAAASSLRSSTSTTDTAPKLSLSAAGRTHARHPRFGARGHRHRRRVAASSG